MKNRIWNMSVRKFDALFGRNKPKTKSEIVREFAKDKGIPVIDIKLSKPEPGDMVGLPVDTGPYIIASGPIAPPDPNPSVFGHYENDPVTGAVTKVIEEKRRINVGDMILMEIQKGVVETVVVDAIVGDTVYGLGEDGEPYCAPLANCDKVPV